MDHYTINPSAFRCTFTGVDQYTDLKHLEQLSVAYPFVEWGMLLSTSTQRTSLRYPDLTILRDLAPKLAQIARSSGAQIALHVCGNQTQKLLEQTEDSVALELLSHFGRIQVNFVHKEHQIAQLKSLLQAYAHKTFITQHNTKNATLFSRIEQPNHQILFDASGGNGIPCDHWQEPKSGIFCGYAGGLGADNITQQLPRILKCAQHQHFTWIDMEAKVRTNDLFDLSLCHSVLQQCESIMTLRS